MSHDLDSPSLKLMKELTKRTLQQILQGCNNPKKNVLKHRKKKHVSGIVLQMKAKEH